MQIELTADQVGAVAARLAQAGVVTTGLFYDGADLHIPEGIEADVQAIMASPNWEASVSQDALLRYAANRRWEVETGGIVIAGVPIATDDRSKTMILGARVAAAVNPQWTTVWHGSDGQTYPLNAAQMIAISNAVEAHVNATFASFADVKSAIEDGVIKTFEQVDQALG